MRSTAIPPFCTSAHACVIAACSTPNWCSNACRWASSGHTRGWLIPVVRIVRGVADLIARPTPHDTQRAVLCQTRPPFSSAQSDVSRCGRPSRCRDTRCQPRVSYHPSQGLPVWHAVKMTGMNSASVALMRNQTKPFADGISMGHTRYAGTTNSLRKRRVLAVSSP